MCTRGGPSAPGCLPIGTNTPGLNSRAAEDHPRPPNASPFARPVGIGSIAARLHPAQDARGPRHRRTARPPPMPVVFKDYYATLGVARDAGPDAIKEAYRRLARKHHPDVAQDRSNAEARFKDINEAHQVLGDPEKRKRYDALGPDGEGGEAEGAQAGAGEPGPEAGPDFHFGGSGFSDFFERYFSGSVRPGAPPDGASHEPGARPRPARAQRGADIEGEILITLEEALRGTLRPVALHTSDRWARREHTREFEIRIPPGATDGRRLRLAGQGAPGRGGGADGDLFLRVRHAAHPVFESRDADLVRTLALAPWEAVLGAERIVATLDGTIKLRVPAGTQGGHELRVPGRGLPKGTHGKRGDLFIVLTLVLPAALDPAQRAAWEAVRTASTLASPAAPASAPSASATRREEPAAATGAG